MILFKLAFRNVLRNARRSVLTVLAISIGTIAIIVFGEYMAFIVRGFETSVVSRNGHLSVLQTGFFEFGAGNPAGYSIPDYEFVMGLIKSDPQIAPLVNVVTPTVTVYGIVGNFEIDTSKTFFGVGVVPKDRERMIGWDDYGINTLGPTPRHFDYGLQDGDETHAIVGLGLAHMLGLCEPLRIANCTSPPHRAEAPHTTTPDVDFAELAARDSSDTAPSPDGPRIELLAATANGAPNVISLYVNSARPQAFKEIDDVYVGMNLAQAQQLLYGREKPKAVSIAIQLNHTADVAKTRALLETLFKAGERGLDLEVRDFTELEPQYNQVINLFGAIFVFIAAVMGSLVLFTIVNTMGMSVMERTGEIGTARAIGVRRSSIRRQFLLEGCMLGVAGATAGVVMAAAVAAAFNHMNFTWSPPGQATAAPLLLLTNGMAGFQLSVWLSLITLATLAALVPASHASRMLIVDALGNV